MRRLVLCLAVLALVPAAAAQERPVRSAIFFYPWYGTPTLDGHYAHWWLGDDPLVRTSFYPARGLYSSSDRRVLASQLREIASTGVDQIVVSWWGRGSAEDRRLELVVDLAHRVGLAVAAHVEPFPDRTARSVAAAATHLRDKGVGDLYVYAPEDVPADAWRAALENVPGRVFAQTPLVGYAAAAGFDGIYTYDILVYGGGTFARLCEQARRRLLLCAPSVGPGYDARRALTGDTRVKPRRGGRTYDGMWRAALRARADIVTITSYNEWHEGTQIEPARPHVDADGERYVGYEGAWGRYGKRAERAYLDRTRYWTRKLAVTQR